MTDRQTGDKGATFIEFIIVVPLLIIFLSGLLMTGILLSQISWSMQSSFETALLGSASSQGVGEGKMQNRFETLRGLMGGQLEYDTFVPQYVSEGNSEFVRVDLNAGVRALGLVDTAFPLGMTVYAHYNNINNSLAGLSQFENPSCHYGVNGSCGGGQGPPQTPGVLPPPVAQLCGFHLCHSGGAHYDPVYQTELVDNYLRLDPVAAFPASGVQTGVGSSFGSGSGSGTGVYDSIGSGSGSGTGSGSDSGSSDLGSGSGSDTESGSSSSGSSGIGSIQIAR